MLCYQGGFAGGFTTGVRTGAAIGTCNQCSRVLLKRPRSLRWPESQKSVRINVRMHEEKEDTGTELLSGNSIGHSLDIDADGSVSTEGNGTVEKDHVGWHFNFQSPTIADSPVDTVLDPPLVPERLRVVLLCFLSFILCNVDRINISVAILPMADHYGWSQTTIGLIQSAFFYGYVLTQIPGGYLADKYGGKQVLSFGVVSWSLMTLLTPFAASTNLGVLLASRALLGIGEGVAMPAMNQIVSQWVPKVERGRSLSLIYSGMYMGSVVGLLLCPFFIKSYGWPSVFYIFGGVGFFWWAAWETLTASSPDSSKRITVEERNFIKKGTSSSLSEKKDIPWKLLLSKKESWSLFVSHFCCTWGYFVLLTWLPTYFNQKLGFNLQNSAFLSVVPWLAMFFCANAGGVIADSLLSKGVPVTVVRKTMQTIGFLGPAVFLASVARTSSPANAVLFMTVALGLGSFSQSGVYANHQDIGPNYAGVLLGISNTVASIPGIVGVASTGYILDKTGSWDLAFGIAIGFYLLGTVVFNLFATGKRVF